MEGLVGRGVAGIVGNAGLAGMNGSRRGGGPEGGLRIFHPFGGHADDKARYDPTSGRQFTQALPRDTLAS